MEDRSARVASLLHEAGETHHLVYRVVDGDDPDWASWYANWLVNLSELPQILGTTPVRSELVWLLVQLDKEYETNGEVPWPHWYADRVIDHFGARSERHAVGATFLAVLTSTAHRAQNGVGSGG